MDDLLPMIRLHPIPESNHQCPFCRTVLESRGWHIPGMRNLADLRCEDCGREFYGDLASGQALYTPMLLEKETGTVHDSFGVEWFAEWLRTSYANRSDDSLPFDVRERSPVTREVVLLNCLDTLYGHSLLKLLNAQHYVDRRPDVDLIVIVPSFLEWAVPDGAAEVWVVGLPLRRGTEWNDWLAREIRRRLETLPGVHLSPAFSHPHPDDYAIERFTRVKPFPLEEWSVRLARPTVSFIWREDRLWESAGAAPDYLQKLKRRINLSVKRTDAQSRKVTAAAFALRREWPTLDFAVVGIGKPGGLPVWMSDLRRENLDTATEREWCERYAASHVVVGVHGSNMLLPSAHSGSVVELIGADRWGNFFQDILFRGDDCRDMFFRYHFAAHATTPDELALILSLMLRGYPKFLRLMGREFCRHGETQVAALTFPARKEDVRPA
jgi:hypothetical protein